MVAPAMGEDADRLIEFVSSVSGDAYLKVEESLGDGFVRLKVSEAERRQAKHDIRSVEDIVVELLRNARDAHAQRIFVATTRDGDERFLTVVDDGVGVPQHLHEAVFEPRVTSKLETMVVDRWGVHGRGMALFSVRSNASVARIACSEPHKGCSVQVIADVTRLSERADQSSWPEVEPDEAGAMRVVRGPHNIARRVVEFACEHPEVEVYLGSVVETVATLHAVARSVLEPSDLLFCDDPHSAPIWQRPAVCADADELVEVATTMGLAISERSAHRILAGEIAPLRSVLDSLAPAPRPAATTAPDIFRDRRSLKLARADAAAFAAELEEAFDFLAERYYIKLRGEPRITVLGDEIRVRFLFEKDE
ncbi:MAG: ATP-binding protein [Coriobacteriia bacterium]|nr:ATP-binding protein [Coriobacteriia bacterium]